MRAISDTLNDAKALSENIFKNMSTIETCEAVTEKIKVSNVCYQYKDDNDVNKLLMVDKVLSPDQMVLVNDFIISMINNKRDEAAKYLDFLSGKIPAIENPNFKAAVDDMVNQTKAEPKEAKGRKVTVTDKIDTKVVQDMLNQGYSQAVIAKKVGVSAGTMCQYIKANKLVKSDKYKAPNEGTGADPKEVQKLLDKGMNSTEIANELGVSASRVRNIKRDNGLKSTANAKGELKSLVSVSPDDKETIYAFLNKKIPEIKALYTNGPFDLKKLAVEYACDKKVLHEFLAEKGLLKKSKNDPFKGR